MIFPDNQKKNCYIRHEYQTMSLSYMPNECKINLFNITDTTIVSKKKRNMFKRKRLDKETRAFKINVLASN